MACMTLNLGRMDRIRGSVQTGAGKGTTGEYSQSRGGPVTMQLQQLAGPLETSTSSGPRVLADAAFVTKRGEAS